MSQPIIEQIKGQPRALAFLTQALESGRFPQTLLFCGPSGVGKFQSALALAQCLACEQSVRGIACGKCSACLRIEKRQSEALIELEPTGANHKIEQVRTLIHDLSLSMGKRRRTVIIKDAHAMTSQSANALLKTLEEPPENTYFVLLAPSVTSVLPTIRSRAQVLQFGSLDRETMNEMIFQNEDIVAIRTAAVGFWADFKSRAVFEKLTSRDSALWVTRFWQEVLRDAHFEKLGLSPIIHHDQPQAVSNLTQFSTDHLGRLAQATLQLERDIQGNADYNLAFENFLRNELHAQMD